MPLPAESLTSIPGHHLAQPTVPGCRRNYTFPRGRTPDEGSDKRGAHTTRVKTPSRLWDRFLGVTLLVRGPLSVPGRCCGEAILGIELTAV